MRAFDWWRNGHPVLPSQWCRKSPGGDLNWLGSALNLWASYTRWVRPSWWFGFVLVPRDNTAWGSWLETAWCRFRGHPGEVYWNPGGLEPDHRCKRCGETIG